MQVTAEAVKKKIATLEATWRARLATRARRWGIPGSPDGGASESGGGGGGLSERVLGVLLKFLRVTVDAVHVQYSDTTSDPRRPFQLGCVLHNMTFGPGEEGSAGGSAPIPGGAASPETPPPGQHAARPADSAQPAPVPPPTPAGDRAVPSAAAAMVLAPRFQHTHVRWDGLFVYMHSVAPAELVRTRRASSFEDRTPVAGGAASTMPTARLEEVFAWTGLDVAALQLIVNDVRSGGLRGSDMRALFRRLPAPQVSGAVQVMQHRIDRASSPDDPALLGIEAHIERLDFQVCISRHDSGGAPAAACTLQLKRPACRF